MDPSSLCTAFTKASGKRFEQEVGFLLSKLGLRAVGREVAVGKNLSGGKQLADWVVFRPGERLDTMVSCKFQATRGTAEQKLPDEILRLIKVMRTQRHIARAHLIIGGSGWEPGYLEYITTELVVDLPQVALIDIHIVGSELHRLTEIDTTPRHRPFTG